MRKVSIGRDLYPVEKKFAKMLLIRLIAVQ
jgi:hypothetical protein